jgi:3'-phosphoadenosine 5'-phosphosulfate sulfotransferase (PAPS reductase)/FAD synthetase
MIRVISLGAGVQSTTLALMAGDEPDCAIFADTGWEPAAVYAHLDWLERELPYPVYRVTQGSLANAIQDGGFSSVPFYTPGGMGARQCTYQYKLRPLYRKVRELLGGKTPKGGCEMWVGISTDEMIRMKDARVQYIKNRFPLVEWRMSRNDCLKWLERNGYPTPPRSACLGCPFKRDSEWRETRKNEEEWEETVRIDREIRAKGKNQYMHRSCKPLDEVDLTTPEDHGQMNFLSECEGMCGV